MDLDLTRKQQMRRRIHLIDSVVIHEDRMCIDMLNGRWKNEAGMLGPDFLISGDLWISLALLEV
jgi:hypothetical protein